MLYMVVQFSEKLYQIMPLCHGCGNRKKRNEFSKSQLRKGKRKRCKKCTKYQQIHGTDTNVNTSENAPNIIYESEEQNNCIETIKYDAGQTNRQKWLDSFMRIKAIKSEPSNDLRWSYSDCSNSRSYSCEICVASEVIPFSADWTVLDWGDYGMMSIGNILQYGKESLFKQNKLKSYHIVNAMEFRKKCNAIDSLSQYNALCTFDWIETVIDAMLQALQANDDKNWIQNIHVGSIMEYFWEDFKAQCLSEREEYQNKLSVFKVFNVPQIIIDLIKCFACTKHGVCCGCLNNDSVIGLDFL